MKNCLLIISILLFQSLCAQNTQQKKEIDKFILTSYQQNDPASKFNHRIDSIIKLKNGNYFVLVANEIENASMAESGSFDCLELSFVDNKYEIIKDVYNIGDNTGGMGLLDITYKLIYLNKEDYIVIINKNIVHHGNYNLMNIILNAQSKLLEISLTDDYSGATTSNTLNDLVKFRKQNGVLLDMVFKVQKTISTDDDKIKIKEKTYQIINSDFDLELGCITRIKLLKNEIKTLD
jgi:hypothetical protein